MKLLDFQRYFNGHRTHAGLGGLTPEPRTGEDRAPANIRRYRWRLHCRGLYQTPSRHDPCVTPAQIKAVLARCRPIERQACSRHRLKPGDNPDWGRAESPQSQVCSGVNAVRLAIRHRHPRPTWPAACVGARDWEDC
jgi:hypothetical protein